MRLAKNDMSWPAMLPAYDALLRWAREHQREPDWVPRQVLIADQRTAAPGTLVAISPSCCADGIRWSAPGRPSKVRAGRA
jgi:hypothetical protein